MAARPSQINFELRPEGVLNLSPVYTRPLNRFGSQLKGTVSLYKGRVLLFLKTLEINRKT